MTTVTSTIAFIFLFLCFIIESYDATVIKAAIQKSAKPPTTKKRGLSRKFLSANVTVPDLVDEDYFISIYIGTPPQTFLVSFELNGNLTWVLDSTYAQIPCVNPNGSVTSLPKFNSTASSTYAPQPQIPPWSFDYTNASGFWGSDTVCVSLNPPLCVPNQQFGQANSAENDIVISGLEDGNAGLRPDQQSVFANLLPNLDAQVLSIALKSAGPTSFITDGGVLTFGAIDDTNCDASSIQYAPIVSGESFYWAVAINGASIGNTQYSNASLAGFEPFASFLNGPVDWLNGVASALNATFNEDLGSYVLPCAGNYPDLVLNIPTINNPSATFSIPASIYIENAELPDTSICFLLLGSYTPVDNNYNWRIGDTFFRQFCGIFDVANQQLGFATPISS